MDANHAARRADRFEAVLGPGRGLSEDAQRARISRALHPARLELDRLLDEHVFTWKRSEDVRARIDHLRVETTRLQAEMDVLMGRSRLDGFWRGHSECARFEAVLGDGGPHFPDPELAYVSCDHFTQQFTYGPLVVRRAEAEAYLRSEHED
jgi:hypothetical protein